jgi:hypothetical protein
MTNGEFVSEVKHHLNAINKDDSLRARYILQAAKNYIQFLISNRPLSSLFRDSNVFVYTPCIEMVQVDSVGCKIAAFKNCDKIMKSKLEFPDVYMCKAGPIIESVMNIDNSVEYTGLFSVKDYKNTQKRKYGKGNKYYVLSNNHLYILGATPEIVNVNFLPKDAEEAKKLSTCEECDECASSLEEEFVCPAVYIPTVRDQTVQLIMSSHTAIPEDEQPDLDSNQKSAKK